MSDHTSETPIPDGSAQSPKPSTGELIPKSLGNVQIPLAHESNASRGRLTVSSIPDPMGLLRSFGRRWLIAVVLGSLVAASVGSVTWFVCLKLEEPRYTTYALLRMLGAKPIIAFNVNDPNEGRFRQTQLVLITSRYVINRALRQQGVSELPSVQAQADPIDWLARSIRVGFVGDSDVLRISMTGEHPEDLIKLVNAVKDTFLNEVVDAERNMQLARIAQMESVRRERMEKLRTKRNSLETLARTLGGSKNETLLLRERAELQVYTELLSQQTRLQWDIIKAEAELSLNKKKAEIAGEQEIPEEWIERVIAADQKAGLLRGRIAQLERYILDFESKAANKSHPMLQKARQDLEATRQQLQEREAELRPLVVEQVERMRGANVAQIEARIQSMREQDQLLEQSLQHHKEEARSIGTQSLDVEFLREEISQIEAVNGVIASQIEQLNVEVQAPSRVTELEKADTFNTHIDNDRKRKLSSMATLGSFGLVVLLICWWDFATHRVDRPNDVEERLGLRVIGAIPALPNRMKGRLPAANGDRDGDQVQNWFHFLTESVDSVRALILHEARLSGARVIMVASAVGREGKTTLSSHLAASLARTGRRTLFIDGDMRRPTSHRLLNQPLSPGLAEVLRGEISWREAARLTSLDSLMMIPAGEICSLAVRELSRDAIGNLFDEFRREFDFVILDSAPVLAVSDALSLGRHADGVIFSLMHEVTQLTSLNEAHERMSRLGIRIMGAVVNGARGFSYGYNYYRNRYEAYGYGYSYGSRHVDSVEATSEAEVHEENPA